MSQIILSQIAALFFGALIGILLYYYYIVRKINAEIETQRKHILMLKIMVNSSFFSSTNQNLSLLIKRHNDINSKYQAARVYISNLQDTIEAFERQAIKDYQQNRELHYKLQIAANRWAKATHHIQQLVHAQKENDLNINDPDGLEPVYIDTDSIIYEVTKMSLGKLLATYHYEFEVVESHLIDRFESVKVKETSATYTNGINYLHLIYDVFGFPAMVNFSRTGNEGYMMVITYRGVIVYSDKTLDKSYFVQVCENAMLEFITKFDLKYGRK